MCRRCPLQIYLYIFTLQQKQNIVPDHLICLLYRRFDTNPSKSLQQYIFSANGVTSLSISCVRLKVAVCSPKLLEIMTTKRAHEILTNRVEFTIVDCTQPGAVLSLSLLFTLHFKRCFQFVFVAGVNVKKKKICQIKRGVF